MVTFIARKLYMEASSIISSKAIQVIIAFWTKKHAVCIIRGHPFSRYVKFFQKLTFLIP